MVYLVTGCAGFIGYKVTELLLKDGHTVIGVDELNDAYDVGLKRWRLQQIDKKSGFQFHQLNICNQSDLRKTFNSSKLDAVINLAARAGVRQSVENPWAYYETNVNGTLNLMDLCRECGVKKFVLASTSSLYGADSQEPFHENSNTDAPISPYAASKKGAETLSYSYHHLHHLDVTVLRFFTVYGPAGRPDMSAFRFVQWISEGRPVTVYGDGKQSRDYTYVDDIARGAIAGIKPLGHEVINLGSSSPVVLMDVIHLVEEMVGKRAEIEYKPSHTADVHATWADIGKAERILGWQPQFTFRDGISTLVKWYQDNRNWAKEIATD